MELLEDLDKLDTVRLPWREEQESKSAPSQGEGTEEGASSVAASTPAASASPDAINDAGFMLHKVLPRCQELQQQLPLCGDRA